ncbi:hypothetical protein M9434_003540 [Picochlorum sp. BPE23]|nr:hypothetical protein M9434_003540 [Picochlorum sp. BPE23]
MRDQRYKEGNNYIQSVEEGLENAPDIPGSSSSSVEVARYGTVMRVGDDSWDVPEFDANGSGSTPGWVARYLGEGQRGSTFQSDFWNDLDCVASPENHGDDDVVRSPGGRGRRGSLEPMSAKVWDDDGIPQQHGSVVMIASGDAESANVGRDAHPMVPKGVLLEKHYDCIEEEGEEEENDVVVRQPGGAFIGRDEYGVYYDDDNDDDHGAGELPGPDRREALNERYKRQLRTYEKDHYGVPLPSTARRFSYFSSPYKIAEVCTGLGVYLISLRAAIVLAIILCVLMIYPLVDNVATQNWSQEYYLYIEPDAPVSQCDKGYDSATWIIKTSVGGHCDGSEYTNPYGCSSKCVWDSSKLSTLEECVGMTFDYLLYTNMTGQEQCQTHMPCIPSSTNPAAPDGPCLCCEIQTSQPTVTNDTHVVILEDKYERIPAARFWMLFLSQLVFMGWVLALMHYQLQIVQAHGNNVVGPSDFTVWISDISPTSAVDSYLRKWCQQFGPIMAAFNVPSVGEAIRVGQQVEDLLIKKEEADADPGHKSWNLFLWIYRKFIVGKSAKLKEKLEDRKTKLKIFEKQEAVSTGYALATFRYTDAAMMCLNTFHTSLIGRVFEMITCGLTSTKPLLHGSAVKVVRAPEPSDMIWEHTECGRYEVWKRRIISWTFTICVIMAGAGIQYGLASLAERLRQERYIADIAAGDGEEESEREAAIKTTRIRIVTILTGVMVVVINFSTMLTVRFLAWYERWTTRTSMERWVMLKLSFSQLINAFAAPVIAAYVSGNKSGWFVRGGLMEAAFFVQCSNALLPPLVHLLGIGDNFKFYVLAPFAKTQKMLNRMMAPPIFPMAEQHAASVASIGLAMFYMPVLPISPYISLVGLILSYFSNKWIALRRAAAPPNLNGMVTSSLNFLLRLLPLVQLILMKYLYFKDYSSVTPVFYTGLAFWIIFMIAPIRALLGTVQRYRRPPVALGLSYSRLLGGMRLGVGDVYSPVVPKTCSRKFKHQVAETFAQLAPAAFDSILNGEEIAAQLSLYGNKFTLDQIMDQGEAAPWTPSAVRSPQASWELRRQETEAPPLSEHRISFTGSIAAGFHETLNLLWRPQDPDHPEDVFRRHHAAEPRVPVDQDIETAERAYGVHDDVPIRAVYSRDTRDNNNNSGHDDDNFNFRPLGSGINRI